MLRCYLVCFLAAAVPTISLAACPVAPKEIMLEAQAPGVKLELIASAGDKIGAKAYRLVGVGDGLGIYPQGKDRAIVLMNHELRSTEGITRLHGHNSAFISRWVLDTKNRKLIEGEDLIKQQMLFDTASKSYKKSTSKLEQFCSADLPAPTALGFTQGKEFYGASDRIFFSGEELSTQFGERFGRGFAHIVTGSFAGTSFELPRLGKMGFENIVLSPYAQKLTLAMLMDDTTNQQYSAARLRMLGNLVKRFPPSELYLYIGTKTHQGATPVEQAGLTNGSLYGIKVQDAPYEHREYAFGKNQYRGKARFSLHAFGDVSQDKDGWQLQVDSINNQVTQFLRSEDGVWNPLVGKQNEFYFTTTDQFADGNTRLHRLRFDDITKPQQGGTIEVVLNGREHNMKMLDNVTIDPWGRVLLQEDPGDKDDHYLARLWLYDPSNGKITAIARHKPEFFQKGQKNYMTFDEESSGIVPAFDTLGEGWYLLNVQAHVCHPDKEIAQHGQLIAIYVPKNL